MKKMSMIKYSLLPILFIFILHSALSPARTWQYYHKKGVVEYKEEMYDFALENLERSLELNPSDFEAANIMAEIYILKNKKEEAIVYFNRSLDINIKQPDILCKTGILLEFYLQYDSAFNNYSRAVEADPGHVNGHLNLIRMYTRKNDRANAEKHFKICYGLGKEEGDKYFKAALEAEAAQSGDAEKLFKIAIEKNPAMTDAYFRLSDIYRRKNDADSALSYIKKIIEITPFNDRAHIHLGHLYMLKAFSGIPGKTRYIRHRKFFLEKARAGFEEALRLKPANTELYSHLADISDYLGEELRALDLRKKISASN